MVYVIQVTVTACEQDQDRTAVRSWSCSQAVRKPVWHIPLLCVQRKTPYGGQRNCPKHVEFYCKNKFEKLVHLVGFVIRIYHDARSTECQICRHCLTCYVAVLFCIVYCLWHARPLRNFLFSRLPDVCVCGSQWTPHWYSSYSDVLRFDADFCHSRKCPDKLLRLLLSLFCATSWSLVQRSPADCGASLCVMYRLRERGGPGQLGAVAPITNKLLSL